MFPFLLTLVILGKSLLTFLPLSDCKVRMKILASSVSGLELVLLWLISLYVFFF